MSVSLGQLEPWIDSCFSPLRNQFPGDHHWPWCSCTHLFLSSGFMTLLLAMVIALVGRGVNPHTKCAWKEYKGLILLL